MIIAIDAMGGDHAPSVILEGAASALRTAPDLRFLLHGDRQQIEPMLRHLPQLAQASELCHSDKVIGMGEAVAAALRKEGRSSSMWRALESVQRGQADVAISAGNTGALMGMAKLVLKTLPGIDRPAIAARWPSAKNKMSLILDLGATVSPSAEQLAQFAIMGAAAARPLLGMTQPMVGLLNVGVEDSKGTPEIREAAQICQTLIPDNFYGFIEGTEIGEAIVDVIITDGFSGNIALKAAEGSVRYVFNHLRNELAARPISRLGGLLAKGALRALHRHVDPGRYNGGVFLGLKGLVVKSHGGCDAKAFANAVHVAHLVAQANLVETIARALPSNSANGLGNVEPLALGRNKG